MQAVVAALPGAPVVSTSRSMLAVILAVDAGVRDPREPRGVAVLARVARRVPVAVLDLVCTPPPERRPCETLMLLSMVLLMQ